MANPLLLDKETAEKVTRQVEFYFSDSGVRRKSSLLEIVSGSEDGMVSLALICSFKRMREHLDLKYGKVTRGVVKAVAQALRNSASLEISQDGKKVGKATKLLEPEDCITNPPAFNGKDYYYWKDRMRIFLESTHMDLWDIVENGPYIPIDAKGKEIPREEWTCDQKSHVHLNYKAKYFLTYALSISEFSNIYGCRTAKEIWDKLAIIHEGTDRGKLEKRSFLLHQYELFEMQDQETIDQMFGRFLSITNRLKSLGRELDNEDLVRKILRSIPKVWLSKVIAITEAKELSKLRLDELFGSLKAHELVLNERANKKSKSVTERNRLLGYCWITMPPAFNGEDYYNWKLRMMTFLESIHIDMWDIVENGPYTPIDAEGNEIPKEHWTSEHKSQVQLNYKAKFFLTFALSRSEYDSIYGCRTAKEVWDKLARIHEGTNQVKLVRISVLLRRYELFEMQDHETIDQMYGRFLSITNHLTSLGREFDVQHHVRKILRSLPKVWLPKVIAIREAKDLSKLTLGELFGSLRAYELVLNEGAYE